MAGWHSHNTNLAIQGKVIDTTRYCSVCYRYSILLEYIVRQESRLKTSATIRDKSRRPEWCQEEDDKGAAREALSCPPGKAPEGGTASPSEQLGQGAA